MATTFTGTVTIRPYSPGTITNSGNVLHTLPFAAPTARVVWSNPSALPTSLQSVSLTELIRLSEGTGPISLTTRMVITVSGTANVNTVFGVRELDPYTRLIFSYANAGDLGAIYYSPELVGSIPVFGTTTYVYRITDRRTDVTNHGGANNIPTGVEVAVFSSSESPTTAFQLGTTIEVTVTLNCTSRSALFTDVCTQFCALPDNGDACYPLYLRECFTGGGPSPPISQPGNEGTRCRTFLEDHVTARGSVPASLSQSLGNYCQRKYPGGFSDLYGTDVGTVPIEVRATDQSICGCSMQSSQYDAFAAQMDAQLQGLSVLAGNKYCLFQPCASSPFKNTAIGTNQCSTPQCLDLAVVTFAPSGAIDSPLTINLGADSRCAGITIVAPPGGSTTTTEPPVTPPSTVPPPVTPPPTVPSPDTPLPPTTSSPTVLTPSSVFVLFAVVVGIGVILLIVSLWGSRR